MRLADWDALLATEIERHAQLPFTWGASDCVLFPLDCAAVVTGIDLGAGIRGKYDTQAGAARLLVENECRDVGEVFAKGFAQIAPAFARRGDIGVIEAATGLVGVVVYGHELIGKHPHADRNVHIPRDHLRAAFRVG